MMSYLVTWFFGFILGVVVAFLVYGNNQQRMNTAYTKLLTELGKARDELKKLKGQ